MGFGFNNLHRTLEVEIESGTSEANEVDLEGLVVVGVTMPAAWDEAGLAFASAPEAGGTAVPVHAVGGDGEYALVVDAAQYIPVDPGVTLGVRFLTVISGTNATPVNQTADRTLVLHLRPF